MEDERIYEKESFEDFHKNVKTACVEKGKTLLQLADYLGMSRQGLNFHLKSKKPNRDIVKKIAEFLNVKPWELLYPRKNKPLLLWEDEADNILNSFATKNQILESIIKYYMRRLPEDELTIFINNKVTFLGFGDSDLERKEIEKIINRNLYNQD